MLSIARIARKPAVKYSRNESVLLGGSRDGWMDGWMDRCIDARSHGWMDECVLAGWTDGHINELTDATDEWCVIIV